MTEASAAFAAVTACDRLLVTWWVFGSDIHIYMVCLGGEINSSQSIVWSGFGPIF